MAGVGVFTQKKCIIGVRFGMAREILGPLPLILMKLLPYKSGRYKIAPLSWRNM